jgi:outer membrane protein
VGVGSAENQNYGVSVAQLQLESAKRDISKNRAGHLPTLDLVAARSTPTSAARPTSRAGTTGNNSIGVQYSMPIFSGFAVTSRVRESIALEDKARNDLEANRRNAACRRASPSSA